MKTDKYKTLSISNINWERKIFMKRKLSLLIVLVLVLSLFAGNTATAATAVTKREAAIVKAYIKTIETGDLKYLNAYKYPGLKYGKPETIDADIKLITPKYSKKYISSKKLYCLYATGIMVVSNDTNLALVKTQFGIYAKKKGNTTYAYTEKATGSDIYADEVIAVENLSTSATSALEEYLTSKYGADTAQYLMYPDTYSEDDEEYTDDEEEYYEDEEEYTEEDTNTSSGNSSSSSSSATANSPVRAGDTYSWSGSEEYLGDTVSATYSLSVTKAVDLSLNEIEKLGFERPTDSKIEYKMVTVKFNVKNAKITQISGDGYMFQDELTPNIWGSAAVDGQYIIGGTVNGFDGSLKRAINAKVNYDKLTTGKAVSFSVEGKIILPVVKGQTNYLVIRNDFESDYESSKMYFKLN
jgi:hypothetical protein